MKAAVTEKHNRNFYLTEDRNYIELFPGDINPSPIRLGDKNVEVGDRLSYMGQGGKKSTMRSFGMEDGRFIEYRGIYEDDTPLILFAVDGETPESIYLCFYYLSSTLLYVVTGYGTTGTGMDIRPEVVRFYEEETK